MGRPCGGALHLFDAVVVLYDVRCRLVSVLGIGTSSTFVWGRPGGDIFMLVGKRIGPGEWYLTYHDNKLAFVVV